MTASEALDWLYSTQLFGVKMGLENTKRLLTGLGIPLEDRRVIHVAGTNGKGSACAFLDSLGREHGLRTGLFTSPHLMRFHERIQINGEPVTDREVAHKLTVIRELIREWDPHPTFFEITLALALDHFREANLDLIILETGLGGRLDATSAITPGVCMITVIGLDHCAVLGSHIGEIAAEKAGILKPGVPLVVQDQSAEALTVILNEAKRLGVRAEVVAMPLAARELGLFGSHQQVNAAMAIAALEMAGHLLSEEEIARGCREARLQGRFQQVKEGVIVDGSHNPPAARLLALTWQEAFGEQKANLILGVLADKDVSEICRALVPVVARVFTVPVRNNPRSCPAEKLAAIFHDVAPETPVRAFENLESALEEAGRPVLIAGSLFLAGEALALLKGEKIPLASAQ